MTLTPVSKTKDLDPDNKRENREICSRSSADHNWQHGVRSYNAHKGLEEGNWQI